VERPSASLPAALSILPPYPAPEGREVELSSLAARCAGAELVEYGTSREGRPLRAVRLPALSSTNERVLCSANIHGIEWIAGRVALGFFAAAIEPSGAMRELRERAELWIAPCLNPDGYAKTWEKSGVGRVREMRTNAEGVDLNRNFPMPLGAKPSLLPVTGSDKKGSTFYRGAGPFSEPETRALGDLFARVPFRASVNLHSFMGTMIPPRVLDPAHFEAYRRLCRAFRDAQPRRKYRRLASRTFDTFTGEQEDHQHHVHRTWAICAEVFPIFDSFAQHLLAPSAFWRFNPRDPRPWVENDVPGITAYFLTALSMDPPEDGARV
jgi:hypothetical protein